MEANKFDMNEFRSTRQSGACDVAENKAQEAVDRVRAELVGECMRIVQENEAAGGNQADGFEDDGNEKFSVSNPIKMSDTAGLGVGSVIKYTVVGQDNSGRFEKQRRYNEFLRL